MNDPMCGSGYHFIAHGDTVCWCKWAAAVSPAPTLENIPDFIEPRFWVERTAHDWGLFYRQQGRKLCLGLSCETITRVRCKVLNEILYEEIQAYARPATVSPADTKKLGDP